MDTIEEFLLMLDSAIKQQPNDFRDFDRTKNVQDQLQEIYAEWIGANTYCAQIDFNEWCQDIFIIDDLEGERAYETPKQLWLAFVMWEKHQKRWDDEKEEWVKEAS